ncbi:MAG: hypothetical protein ACRDTI_20830 [Mycobacterium sp.]
MERDLLVSGFRSEDVFTERLSLGEFASFVVYAPPGTAIYFAVHEGWTRSEHFAALAFDEQRMANWLKTEDATKPLSLQEFRPTPTPRPGVVAYRPQASSGMTAEEYARLAGLVVDWGD